MFPLWALLLFIIIIIYWSTTGTRLEDEKTPLNTLYSTTLAESKIKIYYLNLSKVYIKYMES